MSRLRPTVPPHVAIQEMVAVGEKYGYHLQYGVQVSYWIDADQYLITVPRPDWVEEEKQTKG